MNRQELITIKWQAYINLKLVYEYLHTDKHNISEKMVNHLICTAIVYAEKLLNITLVEKFITSSMVTKPNKKNKIKIIHNHSIESIKLNMDNKIMNAKEYIIQNDILTIRKIITKAKPLQLKYLVKPYWKKLPPDILTAIFTHIAAIYDGQLNNIFPYINSLYSPYKKYNF